MSRFDDSLLTTLEEQAYTLAWQHFARDIRQFPQTHQALVRLERNLSIIALAAEIAASKPSPNENTILDDDGTNWNKSSDLMDNIYLCHRPISDGTEYAVMEHFPAGRRNEVWNRGLNTAEVLRVFAKEQRRAMEIWTEDIRGQVKKFLMQKYPDHDSERMAHDFTRRFSHAVQAQTHEQPLS
jgi:hypothetical protein